MVTWFSAVAVCGVVGFALALLRAAFLPRVTQQFSARSLGLGGNPRLSEVLQAVDAHVVKRPSFEAFRHNLKDRGFWQIVAGLWVLFGALCLFVWVVIRWFAT